MTDGLLHLIVLATTFWGLFRGYRMGFTGQIASVLGIAFGAVGAHAFGENATTLLYECWPPSSDSVSSSFLYCLAGYFIVFCGIFIIFALMGKMMAGLMKVFGVDVLNGISGALFCAFKYLFVLSVLYNFAGGIFPHSQLMKYAEADDGNLVELVMLLAPRVMGSLDCEDLHHMVQLRDAKTIS